MQTQRKTALRLVLAGVVAGACTEPTRPVTIPDGPNAALTAAAGANSQKVKIKQMQLSSNTLRIGGAAVIGQVSIGNTGLAIPSNVVLRGEITQGAASKQAVTDTPTQCSSNTGDAGKLPTGTCDMSFTAVASGSGAGPALVPGAATFTLHVIQTSTSGDTELANKSLLVNLVGTVSMAITSPPSTVMIDGPAITATAVIQNPASSLQGVQLQGWIVQGSAPNQTRRPTGGSLVTCGSNAGVLPPGTCTMTISVAASNVGDGVGLFASGAATFELDLIQTSGGVNTTLDVQTAPSTLIWWSPHFTKVEVQSATLVIGGDKVAFTVDIQNGGPPRPDIILGVEIKQFTSGTNFINHDAGSLAVTCDGGPAGALPTTGPGVCTIKSTLFAAGDANGGAFVAGPAVLFFDILNSTGTLDRKTVDVTLVSQPVDLYGIKIPKDITLGGATPYTAFIRNSGPSLSTVVLQAYLSQGTARRAAGGQTIVCGTDPEGQLPTTTSCEVPSSVVALNAPASGTGTLVPGPAMLEIDLDQQSGGVTTNLDKTIFAVNLVMSGPGIIGIEVANTDILIGELTTYTALLYNPTNSTITAAGIDGYLTQGSIENFGAGGTDLTCADAAPATLPPGLCRMTYTLNTRNVDFAPDWQPGPAQFRLELRSGATVLDTKFVTVNLYRLF